MTPAVQGLFGVLLALYPPREARSPRIADACRAIEDIQALAVWAKANPHAIEETP